MADVEKQTEAISAKQRQSFGTQKALTYILPTFVTLLVCTGIYCAYHEEIGIRVPKFETTTDRLTYTLRLLFFPAATLAFAIIGVWIQRIRYPATRNPLSGNEAYVAKAALILQNTVEQTILFVLNIITFTVLAPERHLFMIPYLIFCFTAGRVAFGVGYMIHAVCRIPGFIWTFLPSMCVFFYNAGKIFHLH